MTETKITELLGYRPRLFESRLALTRATAVPNSNEFGSAVARDSTAAVSNVEPNTVEPNSKDKTNHPSGGNICK